jgi:hypothetical protein
MFPRTIAVLFCVLVLASCGKREVADTTPAKEADELLRVGSVVIYASDLDYQLKEKHDGRDDPATRELALAELAERARFSQAALDANLGDDPVVRAEFARLLASRHRETVLSPKIKQAIAAPVAEARLREIYQAQSARFFADAKRQAAVLWLKPGPDPARAAMYTEKLTKAREWFYGESDLVDHPDKGFSVLAVDHSEHAATRFKGGVWGWIEAQGGATDFDRAIAEIAFSIAEVGEVSPVIPRPEGIFLVRLMAVKPAVQRSFESVRAELERAEQSRLRKQLQADFIKRIEDKYPARE